MRYAVISDLHANLEAVTAVLEDAATQGYDRAVTCGDIVGYGASPNEVVEILRDIDALKGVRGNHDKVATGVTDGTSFHEVARSAALWTREALTPENRAFLESLPQGPHDTGEFVLSHGSPLDEESYILMPEDAIDAFEGSDFDIAFFGHTHFTCAFKLTRNTLEAQMLAGNEESITLEPEARYLINPGSIGQPRDCNPRASYGILDTTRRTFTVRRVAYDVARAQERINAAGLPEVLAHRLGQGV